MTSCVLCHPENETVLFQGPLFRVIAVAGDDFPGYFRLILNDHKKEMTDLSSGDRLTVFNALVRIEEIIRREMQPEKVNWAQFGNMVPHLHWHLIARYKDDPSFPDSVWNAKKRTLAPDVLRERQAKAGRCAEQITLAMQAEFSVC